VQNQRWNYLIAVGAATQS